MYEKMFAQMAAREAKITVERVRELLDYDPETGVFRWKVARTALVPAGSVAGSSNEDGYRMLIVDGLKFRAHRLAWFHVHGRWPEAFIDHINGVRDDNRIANLRDVSKEVNQQNQTRAFKNNRLGIRGVTQHPTSGRFSAKLFIDKKVKHLGYFDTPEEAYAVYVEAKRRHHEGCTL